MARLDVKIDQVIDKTTGKIILDEIDDDLVAHVDELNVSIALFGLVDGLIYFFIIRDPLPEIPGRFFGILTFVIRRGCLYFQDVAHDQLLIVTFRFDEDGVDAGGGNAFMHPFTSISCRVGGIEDGNRIVFVRAEPAQQVRHSGFGSCSPRLLPLGILWLEEARVWLSILLSSIFTNIEDLSLD